MVCSSDLQWCLGGIGFNHSSMCFLKPSISIVIGLIGGAIYSGSSRLLKTMKIDDPLDAFPVHGVCGAWGVLSVGIFAYDSDDLVMAGYSTDVSQIYRLGIQVLAIVVISLWSMVNGIIIFGGMDYFNMLRVNLETEIKGLDIGEHGGSGYSKVQMADIVECTMTTAAEP